MPDQRNPDELGALWIKASAKGDYMTGTINGQAVVCFRNARKPDGSQQPDWRVLKPKPKAIDPARMKPADGDVPF